MASGLLAPHGSLELEVRICCQGNFHRYEVGSMCVYDQPAVQSGNAYCEGHLSVKASTLTPVLLPLQVHLQMW